MRHYRLMIPGPVEAEPELLAPLSQPLRAHYGPEWVSDYRQVLKSLRALSRSERAEIYPIVGPGSAALDAAIGSVIGDGSPILVLSNGFFGERLRQIAASYTGEVSLITAEPGRPIEPAQVEDELSRRPELKTVAVVQGETSTGVLNPVDKIGRICRDHGALLLVDTVASLGGVPLEFDAWGIGLCVSSTQKCLGLAPGLAPLAVSAEAWARIESNQSPGWYLNLRTWKRFATEWGDSHPHPVTMPTGLMRALQMSLDAILAEGLESCWEHHRRMAELMRRGLRELGFELLASDEYALPTVTAVRMDRRISAAQLMSRLKRDHGLLIGGGLGELAGKIVRIGHMGPTASPEQILPTLDAIERVLRTAK